MNSDLTKHEFYDMCVRAYYNSSFYPEKAGLRDVEYYLNHAEELTALGIPLDKFRKLFIAKVFATSRTASRMVTGPARFPVEKNRQRMEMAMRRWDELCAYLDKCYAPPKPKKLTIEEQIVKLESELIEAVEHHKKLLANPELREHMYSLTYAKNAIRDTQAKIEKLKVRTDTADKEYLVGGVKIVESVADNRIRLYFNGKPNKEMITRLKSCAFRWAPSIGAWQGYMTQKWRLNEILLIN